MYTAAIVLLGIAPPLLMFLFGSMGERGRLHPFTVLGWALVFGYTLKSIYLAFAVNLNLAFRTESFSHDILTLGQFAICLGLFSFIVGFLIFAQQTKKPSRQAAIRYQVNSRHEFLYHLVFLISVVLMLVYFYQQDFLEQITSLQFRAQKWYIDDEGSRHALGFLLLGSDFITVYFLYYIAMAREITWKNRYVIAIIFISICFLFASRRNGILVIIVTFLMVVGVRGVTVNIMDNLKRILLIGCVLLVVAFVGLVREGGRTGVSASDLSIGSAIAVTAEQIFEGAYFLDPAKTCLLYTSPSPRDRQKSRMPSSA